MHPVLVAHHEHFGRSVDPALVDHVDGGSGSGVSVADAESCWLRYRLRPRVLRDVSTVDTSAQLLGTGLRTPILIGPTASHGLLHPDGEVATALGAAARGSLLVVSTRANRPIEQIAAAAGPWWFQVYVTRDRSLADALVVQAAECGAGALVLTGDTPVVGRKRTGRPVAVGADAEQSAAVTPDDIARLHDLSGLPVLVKGILRADDAAICIAAGAAGLIVSNHGGRQLDGAVDTAGALPEVVAAAGPVPVLVDGGIRSGTDALIALALGASAVLIGRPALWALSAGGADAVADLIDALTDDLAHVMALAGAARLADLDRSLVTER